MLSRNARIAVLFICFFSIHFLYAESRFGRKYRGPDDPAGDEAYFRSAYMQGNRFLWYVNNNTSFSDNGGPVAISNRWPNNYEGLTVISGTAAVMAARVFVVNDSIPVTMNEDFSGHSDIDTLYFAQQGFRNRTDLDPTGSFEWGMKPVSGYFNPVGENDSFAMSNDSCSWPIEGWPAPFDQKKWPGEWNGRFGRGVIYADQAAYFVDNDAQDQEHTRFNPHNKEAFYYPRPGVRIGDKDPNITIQKGLPWGGIGLRLEIRVFQWNNPQARDATFCEYTVSNISDYDLMEMCFGFYLDPFVGNDGNDDFLYFNKQLDMAYNWDFDGIGQGGLKTCTFGIAYLESPGRSDDNVDNDNDGIIDETRDDEQADRQWVDATYGIYNTAKFKAYYNVTDDFLQPHWSTDEDIDWMDGVDANDNGVYDNGENPGDDVGLDGVGPGELNYLGPDADGSECNHMPDFIEGVGCEPNYAFTDVTESDLLGLTSFHTFDHDSRARIHADDVAYWQFFSDTSFDTFQGTFGSWVTLFATGVFPLYRGLTERISMGLLASYDPQEGLNLADHVAPSLWRKKEVAQLIYERDYRFAQPPKMPTLKATAGDGKVILTWDDMADVYTREPFLRNINDFEGYKLIKATDKKFSDAETITDGYGIPMLKKPIFQCDKINGKFGFAEYGIIDGVSYFLGLDSGIQHYFVDENVKNGKTYYYAVVAFDYGIEDLNVSPSENNIVLELDEAEQIKRIGKNVIAVTPHQKAVGFVEPRIEIINASWPPSTGTVIPKILMPNQIQENHIYKVVFSADTLHTLRYAPLSCNWLCNGYEVYNVTDSCRLVHSRIRLTDDFENAPIHSQFIYEFSGFTLKMNEQFQTDTFDGLALDILLNEWFPTNDGTVDSDWTGWKTGNLNNNVSLNILPVVSNIDDFPYEYEIIWGDPRVYTSICSNTKSTRDEKDIRLDPSMLLPQQEFDFYVVQKTKPEAPGASNLLDLVVVDQNLNGQYDPLNDKVLVGVLDLKNRWYKTLFAITFEEGSAYPQANDVYRLTFKRPFFVTDSLLFKVLPPGDLNEQGIHDKMADIRVVPNPYVATNNFEPSVANTFLNQRRDIMFTHLPAQCDIRIFTASGILVDEIHVDNAADDGTIHWNLLSSEGLEIAAGMYIFHVRATATGDTKIGKFAVIK